MPATGAVRRAPLPVTVIGGYLGAGKTTLVNHLLRTAGGMRLAVLVNDFGEISIDADLIESADDNLLKLAGGCVCCSIGNDMIATLADIGNRFQDIDHVVLETSGVAMPGVVAATVALAPGVRRDAVIVVADALNGTQWLDDRYIGDTLSRQIGAADLLVISKQELVSRDIARTFVNRVSALAPAAPRLAADALPDAPALLGAALSGAAPDPKTRTFHTGPIGSANPAYISVALQCTDALDPQAVADLLSQPNASVLRAKGLLRASDGSCWLLQRAGRRSTLTPHVGKAPAISQIVIIGTAADHWLEPLTNALQKLGLIRVGAQLRNG